MHSPQTFRQFSIVLLLSTLFITPSLLAFGQKPTTQSLKWEKSSPSTVSSNHRSNRYACPLKIPQTEFQRARNINLPSSGKIKVSISFDPYVDEEAGKSSVIDIFGAIIGFHKDIAPYSDSGEEMTVFLAYNDNQEKAWVPISGRSNRVIVKRQSIVVNSIDSQVPPISNAPKPNFSQLPTQAIQVVIDLDKGEWFMLPNRSDRSFKLAPSFKEKSIRIYQGASRRTLPTKISITPLDQQITPTSSQAKRYSGG